MMKTYDSEFQIPNLLSVGYRKGAHALEYALLISIVAAAMVAMQTYIRRAIQAHLKNVEIQLNANE